MSKASLSRSVGLSGGVSGEGLYRIGRHSSAILKGIKGALAVSGICDDVMAEPFHRFREPERARVRQVLDELRPLIDALSGGAGRRG